MTDRWSLGGRIRERKADGPCISGAAGPGRAAPADCWYPKKIIMFNYASHASRPIVCVQCTVPYSHQMSDAYMPVHAL